MSGKTRSEGNEVRLHAVRAGSLSRGLRGSGQRGGGPTHHSPLHFHIHIYVCTLAFASALCPLT